MKNPIWKPRLSANNNGDFISIQSYSGYRLAFIDPDAPEYLCDPNVSEEDLGLMIIDALKQSRFLPYQEACALEAKFDQGYYNNWVKNLMSRYGYKTKRALFKNMGNCSVECHKGIITIRPSHHEKLEAWSGQGITEEDYVKVPESSPPAAIGAALRLAFSRCTDNNLKYK